MSFTAHLNSDGLGDAVEVFPVTGDFTHHDLPLAAAFNPAFVVTSTGALLAFAEGRLGSSHDNAPKTVLINRSNDMGMTWEGMRALTPPGCHFGPRPYTFEKDGKEQICVLVSFSRFHLKEQQPDESQWPELFGVDPGSLHPKAVTIILRMFSDDDGNTWQTDPLVGDRDPLPIAKTGEQWAGFVDFTGSVEQIRTGPFAGRRIVAALTLGVQQMPETPSNNMRDLGRLGSSLLYSDDGIDWQLASVIGDERANEAAATPIPQGDQIVMLRRPNGFTEADLKTHDHLLGYRILHRSDDGGQTWSAPIFPEGLPYLKQDGRRYDHQILPNLCAVGDKLLTATPSAADPIAGKASRAEGVIGISDDMGLTWKHKLIDDGNFSYATLNPVSDEGVIVMFSRGIHGEEGSFMRAFTLDWLRRL